jgi:hypothetical protein
LKTSSHWESLKHRGARVYPRRAHEAKIGGERLMEGRPKGGR